jgi:aspartyl-tRNA(Asn)/glutamyl-tRNA(Gln) amidotransferase subunit B
VSEYEAVIGLEIHAQLLTRTKMFCGCPAGYGAAPNTNVCPVCLGLPGSLPTVNARAVELAVKVGVALGCAIARESVFARKNYFYPDCPKNYQITQYETPLGSGGMLAVGPTKRRIRIRRIHLEEDAGRLLHPEGDRYSYVDMNRAGVPLVEIVTEPDIETAREASLFVRGLRSMLQYIEVCDGNMEEGSLRCDANVSLKEPGTGGRGAGTEIKNLNSFKFIERAVAYEIERQREVLGAGGRIERATLSWDDQAGECLVMRTKEETPDYRYFPEPDLRPLVVSDDLAERIRVSMPELGAAKADRFVSEYGLTVFEASVLTEDPALADYYEATARRGCDQRAAARWIVGEVRRVLNEKKMDIVALSVSPERLSRLLSFVSSGRINLPTAKEIFKRMVETGEDPERIIVEGSLDRITDEAAIDAAIGRVLDARSAELKAYFAGKERVFIFFVGEVMKETDGRADPKIVNERLRRALDERRG